MKKLSLCLLIYLISNSVVFSAQNVEIYTYDFLPPLNYRSEQGELTGIYIEIVKTAVARMPDYTVSFNVVPWARAKAYAKAGLAFAVLPPYFHAHDWLTETHPKRPYIWPYSQPLLTQYDVVVCNEKILNTSRLSYPNDFKGLRFAIYRGDGRAGSEFNQMVKDKQIKLYELKDIKTIVPYLLKERADCTVTARASFNWYLKQMKGTGEYYKLNDKQVTLKEIAVISTNQGYLGYTDIDAEKNFPFKKDFSIKFDIEIYKMKKEGVIQDIIDRFIK